MAQEKGTVTIGGKWETPQSEIPYLAKVQELAALNDPEETMKIVVDLYDAQGERVKVQRAANSIDKTARLRYTDTSEVLVTGKDSEGNDVREGTVTLIFTLTNKFKGGRGRPAGSTNKPKPEAPAKA